MHNSTVHLRLKLYQIVSIIRAEKVGILKSLTRDHSNLGTVFTPFIEQHFIKDQALSSYCQIQEKCQLSVCILVTISKPIQS